MIQLKNITKRFGNVLANDDISLEIEDSKILALLGENGSGKSTLLNVLAGIYSPDSGKILIDGNEVYFSSPEDSIKHKIGMVHQHFKLVKVMTAWENIILSDKSYFFINKKNAIKKINSILETFGFSIDLEKKVYSMSVSEMQTVEIVKMLYQGARLLILDEPTAVLTPQETKRLFDTLRKMKEKGCSVIIITHKLNEVMDISDKVAVLRKGQYKGTVNTAETNEKELSSLMLGSDVQVDMEFKDAPKTERAVLTVKNVNYIEKNIKKLDDFSFDIYGGEILGVAGIVGSGQKELCEGIAGLLKLESGSIKLFDTEKNEDEELVGMNPIEIQKKGVGLNFVPEDRLGMGLVANMGIADNILLRTYKKTKGLFIDKKDGREMAKEIVKSYGVSTPSVTHKIGKLSGGNIQKVLLGREIEMSPKLLLTAYPFRGLDVGASYTVYTMLTEQKLKGVAILLIAEDLDMLRAISDRLMVIHNGKVMGIVDPRNTSREEIGILMMGGKI